MKLNKLEKVFIAVILLGLILIGGAIVFVKPSFDQIGRNSKTLAANIQEQAALEEKLSRLDTIDDDIETQKKEAVKYEGCFYPDLTSYEASEIAMAYLKESGLEAHAISVSQLSTRGLSLGFYSTGSVSYPLKKYSSAARDAEGSTETTDANTFMDGNKKYTLSVSSVTDVSILDEEGNIVDPAKYTETMKRMYKIAVCKLAATEKTSQTVGTISATYQVKGTYKQYEDFVNHIFKLDRATYISSVTYPITISAEKDKEESSTPASEEGEEAVSFSEPKEETINYIKDSTEVTYTITLEFLCVEPMEKLKTVNIEGTDVVVDQRPAKY